jgi:hypothetical protein
MNRSTTERLLAAVPAGLYFPARGGRMAVKKTAATEPEWRPC